MHPETVLLPLSYGVASVLTIGCLTLCAIAVLGGVFAAAASRATAGRFTIRPAKAWMLLAVWSGFTGWISLGYRDQYHFAVTSLAAHQPALPDIEANAVLIQTISPTVWAVKTILLALVGGFLWVGTTRARAAAALLLAHGQGIDLPFAASVTQSRKAPDVVAAAKAAA